MMLHHVYTILRKFANEWNISVQNVNIKVYKISDIKLSAHKVHFTPGRSDIWQNFLLNFEKISKSHKNGAININLSCELELCSLHHKVNWNVSQNSRFFLKKSSTRKKFLQLARFLYYLSFSLRQINLENEIRTKLRKTSPI